MIKMRHKKKKSVIGRDYQFEENGMIYQSLAVLLRLIGLLVIPVWAKVASGYRISGKQNLAGVKHRAAILIANHVYFLDAPIICACVNRMKKTRIISLGENMDIPVVGHLIKALGAIPLADTKSGMVKFSETVSHLLDRGKHILFFAEGALWPYYHGIRPFRSGGFLFAVKKQVPVVPVILLFDKVRGGRERLRIHICEPIMPEGMSVAGLKEKTRQCFEEHAAQFYGKMRDRFVAGNDITGSA